MGSEAFASKSDLRDQVQDFMADEYAVRDLDRAIALCEADIRRDLRVLQQEVTVDLPLTAETLTVPSRFLSARRLYIPGDRPMEYLSPEQLILRQINREPGRPRNYTVEGREDGLPFFRFAARPDSEDYILRLTYMADSSLFNDDDCNAILERWPDIYFYGTIYHMMAFARNIERMPDVGRIYKTAIRDTTVKDVRDKTDGSSLAPRPAQAPA